MLIDARSHGARRMGVSSYFRSTSRTTRARRTRSTTPVPRPPPALGPGCQVRMRCRSGALIAWWSGILWGMTAGFFDGVTDSRLTRPDGRVVAWTEWGSGSTPVLRVPGVPGSRYGLRADRSAWAERDLRMITTERPGFGASTPLPGRGFVE